MRSFWRDVRYAGRLLLRTPGFTAAAVLCLALGIGATTAIFTVVNAVVMRPLPYAEPERLARVYSEFPTFPGGGLKKFWISAPEFLEMRRDLKSWETLDAYATGTVNLSGIQPPVRVRGASVSGSLMNTLSVRPLFGRILNPHDDTYGIPQTAVIPEGLWVRAFGRDPRIIGREVSLDGQKTAIIGVMPREFQFPPGEADALEIWAPLQLDPANPGNRGGHYLSVVGRLRPGVTFRNAQDEIARYVEQSGARATQNFHAFHPKFHALSSYRLHDEVIGSIRPAMLMMLASVAFVLLIACVNVANLLLARAEGRHREIAVRRAMGAGTASLVRQFATEGILLSLLGAAAGLLVAFASLRLILNAGERSIPRAAEISVDLRVLLVALGVSVVTGVLFGLAPLAQLAVRSMNEALKGSSGRTTATRESNRLRKLLVIGELALALILLIGTGLLIRAFWKLQAVDPGLRAAGLLTMRLELPEAVYPDNTLVQFWSSVQDRISSLPGVESTSMVTGLPPARPINANDTEIEGLVQRPGGPINNIDFWQSVGRRYFETMGILLIDGRFFDSRDSQGGPASVIINQTMAHIYYPGQSALGKRLRPSGRSAWYTVVGIVEDVKNAGLDKPTGTELYFPYGQSPGFGLRGAFLVIRASGDPMSLVHSVRAQIAALDPSMPVSDVRTMDEVLEAARARPRFLALLLSLFSGVALALASLGIYGVMSYSVAQRTGEIGLRMAIGAQTADVLKMVLAQGVALGLIGVAAGAAGAWALTRYIRGLLFGIDSFDPGTFATMAALLVGVTVLACYIPALRATRVDPLEALRYE